MSAWWFASKMIVIAGTVAESAYANWVHKDEHIWMWWSLNISVPCPLSASVYRLYAFAFFFRYIKFIYGRRKKKGFNKIMPIWRHVVKSNLNNLTLLLQIINALQQELSSKYQSSFREICHFTAFIIYTTLKSSHVPEILQGSRRM